MIICRQVGGLAVWMGHAGVFAKVFCLAPGLHSPPISSEYGTEGAGTNQMQAKNIKRIQFNLGAQLLMT